jgi:nucleoside-triphosphatase THEP1
MLTLSVFVTVVDEVLACEFILSSFNQEVKEKVRSGEVCQVAVQVNRPKKRVRHRLNRIRKRDQVYSHIPNDSLFVQHVSNGLRDCF